jgi:ABC-2 type transport system permease protein
MPLVSLARMSFRRQLAYRAANLAGFFTNAFFALLRASVLIALYAAKDGLTVGGYDVRAAVTYTGIGQALIGWVALWGWWDLLNQIKTGDVASDLQRPIAFFWYWCAQDFGRALAQLLLRGLPMMLIYALAYPITLPANPAQIVAFVAAMLMGWFISFCWRFIYSLAGFWTPDAIGIGRMGSTIAIFASGFLMPIGFLPPAAQALLNATPFPSLVMTPISVWVNALTGAGLAGALAAQLFWCVAMALVAHLILAAGVRRLVIQGG